MTAATERICAMEGCSTVLSRYNDDECCALHADAARGERVCGYEGCAKKPHQDRSYCNQHAGGVTRPERVEAAKRLKDEGLNVDQIAARIGVSPATASAYLWEREPGMPIQTPPAPVPEPTPDPQPESEPSIPTPEPSSEPEPVRTTLPLLEEPVSWEMVVRFPWAEEEPLGLDIRVYDVDHAEISARVYRPSGWQRECRVVSFYELRRALDELQRSADEIEQIWP